MANGLPFLSLAQASALIRRRELSPVELTRALLERAHRFNERTRAYITITGDLALYCARSAEQAMARGDYRGPLHGIPFAIKDNIHTAGILTTGGTGAFADWVPRKSATAWRRLEEAGAVLLGKTNLHELASGFSNVNPFFGASRNPWDLDRISGGSSGGSAVAIAAGMAIAALGTDTAGSIRVPAAFCGITGLKPTFGRVSTSGVFYLSWSQDHVGPMTRTAEDAALVLNAIAGRDLEDPYCSLAPTEDYTAHLQEGLRGLRLALPMNGFWDFPGLHPEIAAAVRRAVGVLQELGAQVEEVALPDLQPFAMATPGAGGPLSVERAAALEEAFKERAERFSETLQRGIRAGLEARAVDYARALRSNAHVRLLLEAALEPYDAFVLPTTPVLPSPVEAPDTTNVGRFTAPFNRSGQPALSVPCGFSSDGLPIGMMIVGKHFAEATVLRIGHAYQQATDWHQRVPPQFQVEA